MAVTHTHPWSTPSNRATGVEDDAVLTLERELSDAITPAGDTHADITLKWQCAAAAPAANAPLVVNIIESDGTNYDEPARGRLAGQVGALADQLVHYKTFTQVPIGPNLFKIEFYNGTAQTATVTITCRTYRVATDAV